jgi:hypothetical protein
VKVLSMDRKRRLLLGRIAKQWPPHTRIPKHCKLADVEGFSKRALAAFAWARMSTVGQILGLTPNQLLKVRNLGVYTLENI